MTGLDRRVFLTNSAAAGVVALTEGALSSEALAQKQSQKESWTVGFQKMIPVDSLEKERFAMLLVVKGLTPIFAGRRDMGERAGSVSPHEIKTIVGKALPEGKATESRIECDIHTHQETRISPPSYIDVSSARLEDLAQKESRVRHTSVVLDRSGAWFHRNFITGEQAAYVAVRRKDLDLIRMPKGFLVYPEPHPLVTRVEFTRGNFEHNLRTELGVTDIDSLSVEHIKKTYTYAHLVYIFATQGRRLAYTTHAEALRDPGGATALGLFPLWLE